MRRAIPKTISDAFILAPIDVLAEHRNTRGLDDWLQSALAMIVIGSLLPGSA